MIIYNSERENPEEEAGSKSSPTKKLLFRDFSERCVQLSKQIEKYKQQQEEKVQMAMSKHPRIIKRLGKQCSKSLFHELCISELESLSINIELPGIPINDPSRTAINNMRAYNK